jgi:tRNA A37 threonylcarbamoyladenosine modification protein TsaB
MEVSTPYVLSVLDARMGEVYAQLFHRTAKDRLTPLGAALCANPENLNWEALGGPPLLEPCMLGVAGSGLMLAGAPIQERLRLWGLEDVLKAPHAQSRARHILTLAFHLPRCAATQAQPFYLREKVALTAKEQRRARELRR